MSINTIPTNRVMSLLAFGFKHLHSAYRHHQHTRKISSTSSRFDFKPDIFGDQNLDAEIFDVVVVGGGIVGITTARALLIEKPHIKIAVLEKERDIAMHQTGHNSGVIHAGIYYKPNTLKAKFCVAGARAAYEFCSKYDIPFKKCGKLIVAIDDCEAFYLKKLYKTALENGVQDAEMLGPDRIKEIEPHCRGLAAIHSPQTGITDWGLFTKYCAKEVQERSGRIFCNFEVCSMAEIKEGTDEVDVSACPIEFTDIKLKQVIRSKYAIVCGGLYSDKLAIMAESLKEPVIIPFRGEYLELKEEKRHLVRGNIYPVPNPEFPFLGVHFTPRLDGRVLLGPNAVLALSREGYSWKEVNVKEVWNMLKYRGFRNLFNRYSSYGTSEIWKSFFISSRVKELQKYIPELTSKDVVYKGFSGVRAQAVDENGFLVDDLIVHLGTEGIEARVLHVRNAPSPAATSALALSEYIAKSANVEFEY